MQLSDEDFTDDTDSDNDASRDNDASPDEEVEVPRKKPRLEAAEEKLFDGQGSSVAVYYDEGFYPGQVLSVEEDKYHAEVIFMRRVRNKNLFVWPECDSICRVACHFVSVWLGY